MRGAPPALALHTYLPHSAQASLSRPTAVVMGSSQEKTRKSVQDDDDDDDEQGE